MEIPHSPADLSPAWLTEALQHGRVIGTDAVISEFEWSPLEMEGGLYGQIFRLKLAYDLSESDGPRTVIAKFSSDNPEMRQRPNTRAAYEREVCFYQEAAGENAIPVPTCYYADIDVESGWHIILLEDLAPARSGSKTRGCSQTEAKTAIQHIARFHARWWDNPKLDNFAWLALAPAVPGDAELTLFRERLWPEFLRKVGKQLPDEAMEIGGLLGKQRSRIAQRLFAENPVTMIHADYHLENMMFGTAGDDSFFVVDWQFVRRGRGIWDVAYFLSQNLTPEDRRAIEIDLLQDYLKILGEYGVKNYSLDDAMYDYRLSLLHRFGALVTTIAAMPFTEEQIRMHIDVLLPRTISAIFDHGFPRSLI